MNTSSKICGLGAEILASLPDMFVLIDRDFTILDMLHPLSELVSGAPDALIGSKQPEDKPKLQAGSYLHHFQAVLDTGLPEHFVYRSKSGDAETKYYEIILTVLSSGSMLADIRTITEKSIAQIESEHLHLFFAEILDNIPVPVLIKDMNTGRYIYWSRKAEIFGRTTDEMIGADEDSFMPPQQAQLVKQLDRQLAEGVRKQYRGIEKYVLGDGREHTMLVTRTLFLYGNEKLVLASAFDLSELKETQASLMQAKNELAHKNMALYSALSLARVIPWECDLENETFYCDYNAYHPDNAPGPDKHGRYVIPMKRYFAGIHPDYRENAVQRIEELTRGECEEFSETYRVHWFNNQEWEWIRMQSIVADRDASGHPTRLIGAAQKITEQKITETELLRAKEDLAVKNASLSSILVIAQVIPWIGDLQKQTFACDYETYHHDSAPAPDAEGRYVMPIQEHFERIHPDYREHAANRLVDLLEGRESEFHDTYPIHWFNDRQYDWIEAHSSISKYSEEGAPLQLIGSVRVITSQKRMEESLRKAKEQAEQSNMLKTAFLANMSHEIRTPLNAIVGFSELLAQTEDPDEKQDYLTIINNSNALLLQLVGDILDLAKIEAGTLEFTFASHDLNAMMDEIEQTSRMKIDNPNVEIACTDSLPECTIRTDRGRMLQVFYNFINNAAKFTRRGHIHFGYRKHTDGRWYFYVEDTGTGIPADKLDDVFGRFVKLNKEAKGTGLGLAISKSIVERLNGEIGVYSAEGHGSTFWFLLPANSITVASESAKSDTAEIPAESHQPIQGPPTVLIAEDDKANYKLLEAILKSRYTLLHAWNGREAIEMFREYKPSMVLMDIKMPEMDGYEATAEIRKISKTVPIVAVTAFAYPEDIRRILASGFDGCLSKPVNSSRLREKIEEFSTSKREWTES